MNLLFLSRSSRAGGGARWTQLISEGLASRGHVTNVVWTRLGSPSTAFHMALQHRSVDSLCYRHADRQFPADLAQLIDGVQVDWVICDDRARIPEAARFSERLSTGETKVALVCHCDQIPASIPESLAPWMTKIICVSERSAAKLARFSPVVIRNPAVPPLQEGRNIRHELGITESEFVVGYIGRCDTNKRPQFLAEIARKAGVTALVAGPGADAFVSPSVYPTGGRVITYDAELHYPGDWYAALDVYVLPSISEGFPFGPVEALLCGVRVAMTPTSDYPQLFAGAVAFFEAHDLDSACAAISSAPPPLRGQHVAATELALDRALDAYEQALGASTHPTPPPAGKVWATLNTKP